MSRRAQPFLSGRRAAPLALLLLGLAAPALASEAPSPGPHLVQAKVLFQGLEYERCLALLADAPAAHAAEAALYRGLCLHGLGREQAAAEAFRHAYALDARLVPPSFCSPKVKAFFAEAVGVSLEALEASASQESVEAQGPHAGAPVKPVLVPMPVPSPLVARGAVEAQVARLPVAPLVMAGVSVAALGAGVFFGARSSDAAQRSRDAAFESSWARYREAAVRDARVANAGFAMAAGSAVAAGVSYLLLRPKSSPPHPAVPAAR